MSPTTKANGNNRRTSNAIIFNLFTLIDTVTHREDLYGNYNFRSTK